MIDMVKTTVKCPKCKSNSLTVVEVWNGATITWEQSNGQIDRAYGNLEPGDPCKVEARCKKCEHKWTVRAATQISDVIDITTDQQQ